MKGAVLYLDDKRQAVARNRGNGYDAKGNMTKDGPKRFVAAGVDGGPSTTRYVYIEHHGAGWLPVIVHVSGPGTNQALELYTHGPDLSGGIGGILTCHAGTGSTLSYYHSDGNGNVVAVMDTNGTLISRLAYAPFGTVMLQSDSAPRFQWSSKEWDRVGGLSYYGYRYYQPQRARWLSRDLLAETDSISLYTFCRNNTMRFVDYWGEFSCENACNFICGAIAGIGCWLGCGFVCGANPLCLTVCGAVCGGGGGVACAAICSRVCRECKPGTWKVQTEPITCYRIVCGKPEYYRGTRTVRYVCNDNGKWVPLFVTVDCGEGSPVQ